MNQKNQKRRNGRPVFRKRVKFVRFSEHRNLCTLRQMIPGCEEADLATLLQKSIEHIIKLKSQVCILRSLADFYGT
ncbi:hypothetical protein SLEP1_g28583 [Rubroshorea leprosula]|uniref:BHLH domain-containing protein n=1 Tax=Rubroshorea leprosula TaxID=152421 RepID=A0AAV5K6B6_9ROSI|nr:hypothetical protein SLEP1_g28583 [Rubroshorea leprosula]